MEELADVSLLACLLMKFTLDLCNRILHFVGRLNLQLTGSFHIKILMFLHMTVSGQDTYNIRYDFSPIPVLFRVELINKREKIAKQ